jgi:hypothetical protein
MPTTPSCAASAAAVHFGSINESRRRAGLKPFSADELTSAFADVNLSPERKAARPKFSSTGAADAAGMWAAIVAKLNSTLPTRPPIAAGPPSPESSDGDGRVDAVVDWSSISSALNREAGLATPARHAR